MEFPIRLNKFLAHSGYATRRSADALIASGRVFVNGKPATLGYMVTAQDKVELKDFTTENFRYVLYYKPRGVATQSTTPETPSIAQVTKDDQNLRKLMPIGSFDKDSEGLILLTNDRRITERVLAAQENDVHEYEVITDKRVTQTFLNGLSGGVSIEKYRTLPAEAIALKGSTHGFTIRLTEGKKNQIRRMCAALGFQVVVLRRTKMLGLELKKLKEGQYYVLKIKEVKQLQSLLGLQ